MDINLFDFHLPKKLIAQHPIEKRDHSRLLVVNRKNDERKHRHFYDLVDELTTDDILVMNDTKVIPARLLGKKMDTGALIEILLLKETDKNIWEALTKPAKRVKIGSLISVGEGLLICQCIEEKEDGIRVFKVSYEGIFLEVLEKLGTMPLPPYITEKLTDQSRYQTVYAQVLGSAAAPTAGLHFTQELLEKIKRKGIEIVAITLHVGLGTFRPVQSKDITLHHMHHEIYEMSEAVAIKLNDAIKKGKKIVAVGTTTVRTLESNYQDQFKSGHFSTNIFIYPGYQFKVVDKIITNFHLPKSTLMMLVSAFYAREKILDIYEEAIEKAYRFFSFGDSMFLK